jgi:hypothetical protein
MGVGESPRKALASREFDQFDPAGAQQGTPPNCLTPSPQILLQTLNSISDHIHGVGHVDKNDKELISLTEGRGA